MERWIASAFASMAYVGFTSVIAKLGLTGISADPGPALRTCFVFVRHAGHVGRLARHRARLA